MMISIRTRIYLSFFLLVLVFVGSGVFTINTLHNNKQMSTRMYQVIDPSIHALDDFKKMLVESKMYATNWVFLRASQQDKDALLRIHEVEYSRVKARLLKVSGHWTVKISRDSLLTSLRMFEELLKIEQDIIGSLRSFDDYNDPFKKLEAERVVEDEVLPRTAKLIANIDGIINRGRLMRALEATKLEESSARLERMIIFLASLIALLAFVLSFYMTRQIVRPINRIRGIVNDMGRGVTRQISASVSRSEIGEMIAAVNQLSFNLQETANFAHAVGERNFERPFEPLSAEDTLGKALISMRDNLRTSERELLRTADDLLKRNESLESFTYLVSHNLRAPVANIMGLWSVLKSLPADAPQQQREDIFNGLTISVQKLDEIINELNRVLQARNQDDFFNSSSLSTQSGISSL